MEVVRGASPRPKGDPKYFGGTIPWIMISDITNENGMYISKTRDKVTELGAKLSRYLPKGTLILSNSGTVCVPKILAVDGCVHDGFVAFPKLPKEIDIFYLYYWFEKIRSRIIQENRQGITQVNLNTNIVREIPIPLPPFNEQKRIVTKLEELFTKLDAGIEYLKKNQILLKQYRQSVLKQAFEGKLTEKWRKDNTNLDEKTIQLLNKIQNELKDVLKKNEQNQLQSITNLILQERYVLPQSWKYVHLGEVCYKIESGSTPLRSNQSNFDTNGIPFIKVENILKNGKIVLKDKQLRIHPKIHEKNCRSKVYPGDILMNIVGRPLGKIGIVTSEIKEANINQAIVLMRPVRGYNPKIILYCLLSPSYYKLMVRISTGVRQSNIRKSHVQRILVPLMSIKEQEIIIETIEKLLSIVDKSESSVSLALERGFKFRQTILQYAFEGKLVSQDPNDEPAEILLERIKRERESAIQIKKEKSKITKKKSIDNDSKQMRLI